ncbi:hypothetical protein HO173_001843 [Letharia columbiana]|uniref:Uncharacterized protein n=1 Tax=Letharia columbiana TaxID=112416 RepID=A0A8H6G4E4_9LECA|nr:uncharacterized protein HO173_001843 [Letharia columbiana]KAF6240232.1 hypothetical protein HO173_001843 [Letharia columbiana]
MTDTLSPTWTYVRHFNEDRNRHMDRGDAGEYRPSGRIPGTVRPMLPLTVLGVRSRKAQGIVQILISSKHPEFQSY